MKDKIEIRQGDLLKMLVEKVDFLLTEYINLYNSFHYKGKGRVKADPLKITESYEKFLKEEGDIKRLLQFFELFVDSKSIPTPRKKTIKEAKSSKEAKPSKEG